jgi:hypothetical protein
MEHRIACSSPEGGVMNDAETRRMLRMLQTIECLFSENIALKSVLRSHRVPTPVWQRECDRLMNDPEHSSHVKFRHLYDEIEKTRDQSTAVAALVQVLRKPRKQWN